MIILSRGVVLKVDKSILIRNEIFQADPITKAVNAFNRELEWGKIDSVTIKAIANIPPYKTINIGGFLITRPTLKKLIDKGVVKIEE